MHDKLRNLLVDCTHTIRVHNRQKTRTRTLRQREPQTLAPWVISPFSWIVEDSQRSVTVCWRRLAVYSVELDFSRYRGFCATPSILLAVRSPNRNRAGLLLVSFINYGNLPTARGPGRGEDSVLADWSSQEPRTRSQTTKLPEQHNARFTVHDTNMCCKRKPVKTHESAILCKQKGRMVTYVWCA